VTFTQTFDNPFAKGEMPFMPKPRIVLFALLSAGIAVGCAKSQLAPAPSSAARFNGIAKFPGCSGALIRFSDNPTAKAIVLTNGHCFQFSDPGVFTSNRPFNGKFTLYSKTGRQVPVSAQSVIYSTMTKTDITLIELTVSYAELTAEGIDAFVLASKPAEVGTAITMISGALETVENCTIEGLVHELHEDKWIWSQSYKYSKCTSAQHTSGSPLIDLHTRAIVGINNTRNDFGERCLGNSPCEVDSDGTVSIHQGMSYGQQTYMILDCINVQGQFSLSLNGCTLLGH
jgi:hypothetical protein